MEMCKKEKKHTINKPNDAVWPYYDEETIASVVHIMRSGKVNYWTGDQGRLFEKEYADYIGVKKAVALANGTVALELALKALGVSSDDEVIVTPRSFIASVSCVITVGAKPVFADVDLESGNITAQSIEKVITKKTKAIISVHLAGWPCEMDAIMALAKDNGLYVIEDCAQAHGAKYKNEYVGSIGHVSAWSFCQDKIMTTCGEGGMLTTNNKDLWNYAWSYKDHGKSFEAVLNSSKGNYFKWLHHSIGSNWRMSEIQAAVGRIQITKINDWHEKRTRNAETILEAAKKCPGLRVPQVPGYMRHAWYKCYVYVRSESLKTDWSRDRIVNSMNEKGVPCYSGSCSEIYLEKAFVENGFRPKERLKNTKELGETSLMFLVHPTLVERDIDKTCSVLTEVMLKAKR